MPLSLAFSILFHFLSGAQLCTLHWMHARKNTEVLSYFFSAPLYNCTPVGCTSAVTPDPRLEDGCIMTRGSLVSHVALSGHVSRDIASQLIPISPPSLEIAVVWPPVSGQKPNVKKQVPECKSHPWPAWAWLWVLITQSPPGCWPEPPLAEPGHAGLWLVPGDPSLVTAFLACAVARGSQGLTSRKYFTKYYTIQYTGSCHKKWAPHIWNVTLNLFFCNK